MPTFAIWKVVLLLGVVAALLIFSGKAIAYFRNRLIAGDDSDDDSDGSTLPLTTAEVERLRSEGLLTDDKYALLKEEAFKASLQRARRARRKKK